MSSDKESESAPTSSAPSASGAPTSSPAASSSKNDNEKKLPDQLNLKVIGQDGQVIQFKIKSNTPFRKLMNVYCDRQKLVQNNIREERRRADSFAFGLTDEGKHT
jgi:hypothetical protein